MCALLEPCLAPVVVAKHDAVVLQVLHGLVILQIWHMLVMCRINKASAEWLDGVRQPEDESGSLENPEGADSAEAPSEEQEKTAAVTSA